MQKRLTNYVQMQQQLSRIKTIYSLKYKDSLANKNTTNRAFKKCFRLCK